MTKPTTTQSKDELDKSIITAIDSLDWTQAEFGYIPSNDDFVNVLKPLISQQGEQARQELLNELSSLMEREETYLKDKDGEFGWYLWVSHLADFINDKHDLRQEMGDGA